MSGRARACVCVYVRASMRECANHKSMRRASVLTIMEHPADMHTVRYSCSLVVGTVHCEQLPKTHAQYNLI